MDRNKIIILIVPIMTYFFYCDNSKICIEILKKKTLCGIVDLIHSIESFNQIVAN